MRTKCELIGPEKIKVAFKKVCGKKIYLLPGGIETESLEVAEKLMAANVSRLQEVRAHHEAQ